MSTRVRKIICYFMLMLFFVYFGAVGAYYVVPTEEVFRLWELAIILSGMIEFIFIVSVIEDAEHNTYWLLAIVFGAASMVTTIGVHYETVLNGGGNPALQPNDSLAWGLFFGIACLFASGTIKKEEQSRRWIRILFIVIGIMCILGMLGPATGNIFLWFIAVGGYGPVALILCIVQMKYLKTKVREA